MVNLRLLSVSAEFLRWVEREQVNANSCLKLVVFKFRYFQLLVSVRENLFHQLVSEPVRL